MTYKCVNCNWEGDEPVRNIEERLDLKCPVCGDETKQFGNKKVSSIEEINLDLNNDGVVDAKDASIAGKVLNKVKGKKRGKR